MRINKMLLATLIVAGLSASSASAQTPYIVSTSQGTYTPVTGGTTYMPVRYDSGFDDWDEGAVQIPLPFNVSWYGTNHSSLYAYTNGFVSFSSPPVGLNPPISAPVVVPSSLNDVHDFIGVMWADLDKAPAPAIAAIRGVTTGAVGSRTFTIQYENLVNFFAPMGSAANFQIRFREGSSQVDIVMGTNFGIANAATAIENGAASEGRSLLACAPANCSSTEWPTGLTITVALPPGPELAGSITAPPGGYPLSSVPLAIVLQNLGLSATPAFQYRVYFGTSNTSTAGSTQVGVYNQASMPATSVLNPMPMVTVPSVPVGSNYRFALLIDVNHTVPEVLENNNLVFSGPFATGPDLNGVLSAPVLSGPGEVFAAMVTLHSTGAPVPGPVRLHFYLSADMAFNAGDTDLGTQSATMPNGFDFSGSFNLTVPPGQQPSPPNYYVLALVDDNTLISETNENNNLLVSPDVIHINGPELEVRSIDAGPFAFRGLPYPVTSVIQNLGGSTATNLTLCLFLSDNLLISVVTDPRIADIGPITLAPGESQEILLQPVIPTDTATGAWYVAAIVDCDSQVVEINENNNVRRRTEQIIVRDPAPDFVPAEIATTTAAAAGETMPVSVRVANLGNLTGQTHVRLVISSDPGIDPGDRTIHLTQTPISLTPPNETTLSVWGDVPGDLASGNYYVGAIVDPDNLVDEVDEGNNTVGAGPVIVVGAGLAITSPNPPNAIIGAPYAIRFHAVGGSSAYAWTLSWPDGAPAGFSFDPALAQLSGMPQTGFEGRHNLDVSVSSGNLSATKRYSLLITQPTIPLTVVSSRLPPAVAMESYMLQLVAVGGTPPYVWTVTGQAPLGLGLSPSGELGGIPQMVGSSNFNVRVTDLDGADATATLSLDIVDPQSTLSIRNADVPNGVVAEPYTLAFAVDGGSAPFRWRMDGQVPGLAFDTGAATLTGTPTVAGSYPIVIEVRDADGLLDRNAYVLEVLEEGELRITTGQSVETSLPKGKVGNLYVNPNDMTIVRLRAVPPEGVLWTIVDGSLPPGLTLEADTGIVSGTPSAEGLFPFIVLATNQAHDVRRAALVILVDPADSDVTPPGEDGCGCTAGDPVPLDHSLPILLGLGALFVISRRKRRRKKSLLTMLMPMTVLLLWARAGQAQPVPYTITSTPEPYTQLVGATLIANMGDAAEFRINLPFEISVFEQTSNALYVNANGFVSTVPNGPGYDDPPTQIPRAGLPNGFVAGLWDNWCYDLNNCWTVTPGIGVFYKIDATPGQGVVEVEFRHVANYWDFDSPSDVNFRISIYEGLSGAIALRYGAIVPGIEFSSNTEFFSRIGVESGDGQYGEWLAPCAGVDPCSATQSAQLHDTKITLSPEAGEDLTVGAVSLPAVAYPGLAAPVSARVISRHGGPLGPFRYRAYLLSGVGTSTSGPEVYASGPISLTAFESRLVNFNAQIPSSTPAGQYRIGVRVDSEDAIAESFEDNNFDVSNQTLRIVDRAPDFHVISVRASQTQLAPGSPVAISFRAENMGNEPGQLVVRAVLSQNQAITSSDLQLGSDQTFETAIGQVVTGTISATIPAGTQTGAYNVGLLLDPVLQVSELNEANNVGRSPQQVIVSAAQVEIITDSLPVATLGRAYSAVLTAAGGSGTFSFSQLSGTLPRGLAFRPTQAEIFGIPLEAGNSTVEFQATSNGISGTKSFELQVIDPSYPLTLVTRSLPAASLGEDYSVELRAVGGSEPYGWRVSAGSLPTGFLLAHDGTLYGTGEEVGYSQFTVELRDNAAATASVSLGVEVRAPGNLTIASNDLPSAKLGDPYSYTLRALGGSGTLVWRFEAGEMVPGLALDGAGTLSGIPEEVGSYVFSISAEDMRGNKDTASVKLTVEPTGRFAITTESLPEGRPGQSYRAVLKASGGEPMYTWEIVRGEGFLPPGFSAVPSDGTAEGETPDDLIISGTLEREGVWVFTLRVHDKKLRSDEKALAIVSKNPTVDPGTPTDEGCGCRTAPVRRAVPGSLAFFALGVAGLWLRRKRLSTLFLVFGIVALPSVAAAQIPYFANQYAAPYQALSTGTALSFVTTSPDDGEMLAPIGFAFTYYGQSYSNVTVGVNGSLIFSTPCTTSAECPGNGAGTCVTNLCRYEVYTSPPIAPSFPNVSSPQTIVSAFWDDLYLEAGSTILTATLGTAPNRTFVVEWRNIRHYPSGSGTSAANFQIHLEENSGAVRLHYGPYVSGTNNTAWSGAMGMENEVGTAGLLGRPCANTSVCDSVELIGLQNQVIEFVGPTGPELIVSGTAPTGGNAGTPISVDVTARNIGPLTTGVGFQAQVYFSLDATIDSGDMPLGAPLAFPALGPMSSNTLSRNSVVPAVPPGFYTIGAIVDSANAVAEDVEANNSAVFNPRFLVGSDFAVTVANAPSSGPGEIVPIDYVVLNNGAAQPAVNVHLYYSRNNTLDSSDTLVASATVALPATLNNPFTVMAAIPPIMPASYYTIAVVDPNHLITEADESNNVGVSPASSELTGPDLFAMSVAATTPFAFRGQPLQVTSAIRNIGGSAAHAVYYGYFLSDNLLISVVTDTQVGEIGPLELPPGATLNPADVVQVPANLTPGLYYLAVVADSRDSVLEESEQNNVARILTQIEVRDPAPDFSASEVRVPANGAAGESLVVERIVTNQGNAAGMLGYDVYLSRDPFIDTMEDLKLGSGQAQLGANVDQEGVDRVLLPASVTAGAYFLGYVLDPDNVVAELYEDNNVVASMGRVTLIASQLQILTQGLPIATLNAPYDLVFGASGGVTGYSWALDSGSLPAGLALDADGRLHGTPSEEGPFMFNVRVSDSGLNAVRAYTLLVAAETLPLEIVTAGLVAGFVDRPYEYPVTAFGGIPPYRWTETGDPLPAGIRFSDDGEFLGTPTGPALANLTVRVSDAVNAFAEKRLILRVVTAGDSVRIGNDVLPDGRIGEEYNEELRVAQGTGSSPFEFSLVAGELPPGLTLSAAILSGTPQSVGTFECSVRVADSRGDFDLNRYLITIEEGDGVTFVTTALPRGEVGKEYKDELNTAVRIKAVSVGQQGSLSFSVVQGELPPGLTLDQGGIIAGTPSSAGVYSFTALAVDGINQVDVRAFGVVVSEAPSTIDPTPTDEGCGCNTAPVGAGRGLGALFGLFLLLPILRPRRRRLGGLAGLVFVLLSFAARPTQAQSGAYMVTTYNESFVARSSGGTHLNFPSIDDSQVAIPIPFPFHFFNANFSSVNAGTNGYVAFSTDASRYVNTSLPVSTAPTNMIGMWWDDWNNTGIDYFVEGTAPNRVLLIQYTAGTSHSSATAGMPQIQLWLYEGPSARFEVHYGVITSMSSPTTWSATPGFQNEGNSGQNFLTCAANCSGTNFPTNTVIRSQQDGGEDVIATSITVPAEVYAGVSFPAQLSLQSPHQTPIGPFVVTLHLLAAGETIPNHPISTTSALVLAPFQNLVVTATPTVPLNTPDGRYRLAMVADSANQVTEPNETNNTVISATEFRIGRPQPDFRVASITTSTSAAPPGGSVSVYVRLANAGNADGTASWQLVLSRNNVISVDDLMLHADVVPLGLLSAVTATVPVTLPANLAPGRYYFGAIMDPNNDVDELVEINNTGFQSSGFSLAVNGLGIATTTLPPAFEDRDYTSFLVATGGDGSYGWRISSGGLPQGITLSPATGELRGRATSVGSSSFELEVASAGQTFRSTLSLEVVDPNGGLTIVTRNLLPGVVGQPYPPAAAGTPPEMLPRIVAVGGTGPVTFSFPGASPPGLVLDPDGLLHGIPTQAGVYDVAVSATDGTQTTNSSLRMTIGEPGRLTLVASLLPNGRLGEDYNQLMQVLGRSPTASVSFSSPGPLPPGLAITDDGRIVGLPQNVGVWTFSVEVSEGTDVSSPRDSAGFRLQIDADGVFGITPSSLPAGTIGELYMATLEARQGRAPYTWRVMGPPLERGLRSEVVQDPSTNIQRLVFTGTPEEAGAVAMLVTLTDVEGRTAQVPITLVINELPPPPPRMVDEGCGCVAGARPARGGSGAGWAGLLALALLFRRFSRPSSGRGE